MRIHHDSFSYLQDASVPLFEASDVFTVMDSQCGLCAKGAAWIARNDRQHAFTIIPVQSAVGTALLSHYGLNPDDPASWLYVENGKAYASLEAVIRAGVKLGGVWKGLMVLNILPKPVQDFFYNLVARNRYRFFGRTDMCSMPDPEVQTRLLK
jgi:predicted DCC family thiol-disulfide oxidoreductase YuxK